MARPLPGTALRVRRGQRRDLAEVASLLGSDAAAGLDRVFRRVLADLGTDVYLAEDAGGAVVGVVAVTYLRSLMRGGRSALLDGARARHVPVRPVLESLVVFAEERARRRGCRRLAAWVDAEDTELRATLLARGYRPGDLFVTGLADLAG